MCFLYPPKKITYSLSLKDVDRVCSKCPGCPLQGLREVSQDVSGMRQLFPTPTVPSRECLDSEGGAPPRPEINLRVGEQRPDFVQSRCTSSVTPCAAQPPFPPGPAGGWEDRVACLITHSGNLGPEIRRQSWLSRVLWSSIFLLMTLNQHLSYFAYYWIWYRMIKPLLFCY